MYEANLNIDDELDRICRNIGLSIRAHNQMKTCSIGNETVLAVNKKITILEIRNYYDFSTTDEIQKRKHKIDEIKDDIKVEVIYFDIHGNTRTTPPKVKKKK